MYMCPWDYFSDDGEVECHRKIKDEDCPAGYQEIILKTDFNDLTLHYQTKTKECVEIGTIVNEGTNVVPDYDSLPYCDRGEYVKIGFADC